MQIPQREDHALVVSTDSLPDRFQQYMMQILQSREGQAATDLGTVLDARMMPDGTLSVLKFLHHNNLLQPIHIDQVSMLPLPSRSFPLREVLEKMGRYIPEEPVAPSYNGDAMSIYEGFEGYPVAEPEPEIDPVGSLYAQVAPKARAQQYEEADKFNPHAQNQRAGVNERAVGIANNLLMEASDLEFAAQQKREKAYEYAPQLRPQPERAAPTKRVAQTAPVAQSAPAKATRTRKAAEAVVEVPVKATRPRKASK
jgi:hypothetical protein